MTQQIAQLTTNEALVLQQVFEDGEDDARTLARSSGLSRRHALEIITRLKKKGLVSISDSYGDLWVSMTAKGKQLMRYLWPEARSYAQ